MTHCGWNSVLEATCAGVPMVAWPLYAEQKMNRIVMVEDMKLALPMDEIEGGKVAAAEIEKQGRRMSQGSSHVALSKLVECWDAMRRLWSS